MTATGQQSHGLKKELAIRRRLYRLPSSTTSAYLWMGAATLRGRKQKGKMFPVAGDMCAFNSGRGRRSPGAGRQPASQVAQR